MVNWFASLNFTRYTAWTMAKKTTIEDLAVITAKGFGGVDKQFEAVDKRFDGMDKRFDRIENLLLRDHLN